MTLMHGEMEKMQVTNNLRLVRSTLNSLSAFGFFFFNYFVFFFCRSSNSALTIKTSYSSRYTKNGWKYFSNHSSLLQTRSFVLSIWKCTLVPSNFVDISNRESLPSRKHLCSLFTNALEKKIKSLFPLQ